MSIALNSMNAAVQRTGLSAHVIRVWERRYGAVQPERTDSNRRLYSEEQIERLVLLRQLTETGQGIRYVAKLPTEQLRLLAARSAPADTELTPSAPARATAQEDSAPFLERCLEAVRALDSREMSRALKQAEVALGAQGLLQHVVAPLARRLGTLWREGSITAAHEHLATGVLRTHLAQTAHHFGGASNGPLLVVATPLGQLHEIGALLVCALAANLGWQTVYLGTSLPAPEIAGAARQSRARAVALSIVYPDDDPRIANEVATLREALPNDVAIIVGGRAADSYRDAFRKADALFAEDLAQLGSMLDGLRNASQKPEPS